LIGLSKLIVYSYVEKRKQARSNIGRPTMVEVEDEVLLLLIWLHHEIVDVPLGSIFSISQQTAHNVRK
jgi:hypothetical protein